MDETARENQAPKDFFTEVAAFHSSLKVIGKSHYEPSNT